MVSTVQQIALSALYNYGDDIPKKLLDYILTIPAEHLIPKLELMLEESLSDQCDEKGTGLYPLHALLLLGELKSEKSLPLILKIFGQPESYLEYWFDDYLSENLWQVITQTAINNLDDLLTFIKIPINYLYARWAVLNGVSNMLFIHPEKHQEINKWYERLLDYLYNKSKDNEFNSAVLIELKNIKPSSELIEQTKKFFTKKKIDKFMVGNWNDYYKNLNNNDNKVSLPKSIADVYASHY